MFFMSMIMSDPTPDGNPDLDKVGEAWEASARTKPKLETAPYLRGPIPWLWIQRAINLGESALATGLAVWHLRALNGAATFTASLYQLRKWTRLSEKATRSGRQRLEEAGLLSIERPAGQSPVITVIDLK